MDFLGGDTLPDWLGNWASAAGKWRDAIAGGVATEEAKQAALQKASPLLATDSGLAGFPWKTILLVGGVLVAGWYLIKRL